MQVSTQSDVQTPVNIGSALQVSLSASDIDLATAVPASGFVPSQTVTSNGYKVFSIGMTSSQNGTLTVQRYLDAAATIVQDENVAFSINLVAGQPANLNVNDWKPFQSIVITVTNSSGVIATISLFKLLFQSY